MPYHTRVTCAVGAPIRTEGLLKCERGSGGGGRGKGKGRRGGAGGGGEGDEGRELSADEAADEAALEELHGRCVAAMAALYADTREAAGFPTKELVIE